MDWCASSRLRPAAAFAEALEGRVLLALTPLDPGFGNGVGLVSSPGSALALLPDVYAYALGEHSPFEVPTSLPPVFRLIRVGPNGAADFTFSQGQADALPPPHERLLGGS